MNAKSAENQATPLIGCDLLDIDQELPVIIMHSLKMAPTAVICDKIRFLCSAETLTSWTDQCQEQALINLRDNITQPHYRPPKTEGRWELFPSALNQVTSLANLDN